MSELERLDEAFALYDEWMNGAATVADDFLHHLADAARVYRDLLANGQRVDATEHLCEDIHEDEFGFHYAICTCGEYRTAPVPDTELLVDELMVHAARSALLSVYPKEAENADS